jgi:hypothetical protein
MKLVGIFLLLFGSLSAMGQAAPSLEIFTSADGVFQFIYPESYELLVGERMLKATQGRHLDIPVCDFSTALVCVLHPIERLDDSKVGAAGFSVDVVRGVTTEADCLSYADRLAQPNSEQFQPAAAGVNGRVFRHASTKKTVAGRSQSADLYRTFQKDRCYELRISVSFSDELNVRQASAASPDDARADNTRESLKLILASFAFKP